MASLIAPRNWSRPSPFSEDVERTPGKAAGRFLIFSCVSAISFGTAGAFVAGSEDMIETLIQFARPYIYTTALPAAQAAASLAAVKLARSEHWRRERLHELALRLRERTKGHGFKLLPSDTPIQPLLLGSAARALQLSQFLYERGIWVAAIRPPACFTSAVTMTRRPTPWGPTSTGRPPPA